MVCTENPYSEILGARRAAQWSVAGTTNLAPKGPRSGHTHHLGNSPRQGVIFSRYLHHGPLWRENKPEFSVFHEKLILAPPASTCRTAQKWPCSARFATSDSRPGKTPHVCQAPLLPQIWLDLHGKPLFGNIRRSASHTVHTKNAPLGKAGV